MDVWVAKAIQQMERQARTNTHYRQQKYNLLQEESEGYAKLITTLHTHFTTGGGGGGGGGRVVGGRVTALIGYFDLDPNRVLDVLLSVYVAVCGGGGGGIVGLEAGLGGLLQLLQLFGGAHLTQLVGFQLQRQLAAGAVDPALLNAIGLLVREGRLSVEDVWSHVGGAGGDEEMAKLREEWEVEERQKTSRIGLANLASTADSKPEDDKKQPTTTPATTPAALPKQPSGPSHRDDAPIVMSEPITTTSPSLILEQQHTHTTPAYLPAHTTKLALLAALITAHAWPEAERLAGYLAALDPVSHPLVSGALCGVVARLIEPVYVARVKGTYGVLGGGAGGDDERVVDDGVAGSDDACVPLPAVLVTPLTKLGPFLYTDPLLWTQLCRVLSHVVAVLKKRHTDEPNRFTLPPPLLSILITAVLPAYVLLPSSIACSSLLWSILSPLPYTVRYSLYGYWHHSLPTSPSPPLHSTTPYRLIHKTRYFRKRISTAKVKECSRLLLKFALASPTAAFALMLQQVQQFDNMIACGGGDAALHAGAWCWTVWRGRCCCRSASASDKLKDDGMNESDWYQSLCRFAGAMYRRRWPDVECEPLVQYVMNQLKSERSRWTCCCGSELVAAVSGVEVYEEMSELVMEGQGRHVGCCRPRR